MDKKGISAWLAILLIGVGLVAIVGGGYWAVNKTNQNILQISQQQQATVASVATEGDEGNVASVKVLAYDQEADDTSTMVAITAYCREKGGTGLIADAKSLSSSDRTSIATTTGKTVECIGFNTSAGGYYGDWNEVLMKTQTEFLDLDVHRFATSGKITLYSEDGLTSTTDTTGVINVTIPTANGQGDLSKVKFKVNQSNVAYNFAGFYFDENDNTNGNITAISIGGGNSGKTFQDGADMSRLSGTDDFIQELTEPVMLHEYDELEFGNVVFTTGSNGCANTEGDQIRIYAYDNAHARSQKSATILDDVPENDADSASDVGAGDITGALIYCTNSWQ